MLNYHYANSQQALLDAMLEQLSTSCLKSPMQPEIVITSGMATARWLNLQFAKKQGVACNIEYPLPASFIWDLAQRTLPGVPVVDELSRDRMAWRIFFLLPQLIEQQEFAPLAHYLAQDQSEVRRWQLSQRISDVFDRYQYYRPNLIRKWSAGKGSSWESVLWRTLLENVGTHRVAVIDRFLKALPGLQADSLPERISIYSVNHLPPLLLEVVQALSLHVECDWYQLTPTPEYWADLVSLKALSQRRLSDPESVALWDSGNSLLASWGKQGQVLQDLLLNSNVEINWQDHCTDPGNDSLLQHIQQDMYQLREYEQGSMDDSLAIHVCHSPLRECQVLHDAVLEYLKNDEIQPEDILVLVPEISKYAPYIETVFRKGVDDKRPSIPWNISDVSIADEHPIIRIFLQLLALPDSRFQRSEILSYLSVPDICKKFSLDDDAVEQIRQWLDKLHLNWGLDGQHKAALGLPETEQNTWHQLQQRLFTGYALGNEKLFADIAPVSGLEETQGAMLGRFWHLLDRLNDYRQQLKASRTTASWRGLLNQMLDTFFSERDGDGKLQQIRNLIADLETLTADQDQEISIRLVRYWLNEQLSSISGRNSYHSGGVSFCGMQAMRSATYKVICLLGMNDQAFPRRQDLSEFDRMSSQWRHGDPKKQDEDRYLLLETLISAQQKLYISYVGRDMRSDAKLQPSLLVSELLDYVAGNYAGDIKQIIHVHPMQAFSARNYAGEKAGFDSFWYEVTQRLAQPKPVVSEQGWFTKPLESVDEDMREISLRQLIRFSVHPVRYFVNTRLKLYLRDGDEVEDVESFKLDGLEQWSIRQRLLDSTVNGNGLSRQQLVAEGLLPHGSLADLCFDSLSENVAGQLSELEAYQDKQEGQILVDFDLETPQRKYRLSGQVKGIYPEQGLIRYTASKQGHKNLLPLWIEHLAWIANGGVGSSVLYCKDSVFQLQDRLNQQQAIAALASLCDLYWKGLHEPLPIFPRSSYAYMTSDKGTTWHKAWIGDTYRSYPGDKDDPYTALVMRSMSDSPIAGEAFCNATKMLYGDLAEALS